jgi:hypothetical protein
VDEDWTPQATRWTQLRRATLNRDAPPVLAAWADIRRPEALAFVAPRPDPPEARHLTVSEVMT